VCEAAGSRSAPGSFTGTTVIATTSLPGSITGVAQVQLQAGGVAAKTYC
jgi:hypothetical protein